MRSALLLLFELSLYGQTQLYVPTGPVRCIASATNATPIVIATSGCDNTSLASASPAPLAHGWSNGQVVVIAGVEGNTAANGTRMLSNVTATTAELSTVGGGPVVGSGDFVRWTNGSGTSYPTAAAGSLVTLRDHPRVWLDGPGGALTSTLCTGSAPCKAVSTNPAWAAMKTAIDVRVLPKNPAAPDAPLISQMQNGDFGYLSGAALVYQSTGLSTYRTWVITALNNIEKYTNGWGCVNEAIQGCGDSITLDYSSKYLWNIAQAYSIVRSAMTPTERSALAGKLLNDVGDSCVSRFYLGSGTVASIAYGKTLTGNGTLWLTDPNPAQRIAPGDSVTWTNGCTTGYCSAMTQIVETVPSDTSLTFSGFPSGASFAANVTAGIYWIGKPWAAGNCGLSNFINHSGYSTVASGRTHPSQVISGVPSSYGGYKVYINREDTREELYNQHITKGLGFLALAIALADDDPRAQYMLQRSMFWWNQFWYPLQKQWATGAMQITAKYYATRVLPFTMDFALQLRNSFVESSMDYTGGNWLKLPLSFWVYGYNRAANSGTRWGGAAPATMEPSHWKGVFASASLQPDTDEAKALRYILKNWTGFWGPAETQFAYGNMGGYPGNFLYYDPTQAEADPNSTLPLSRNLTISDTGALGEGTGLVLSRTGWLADSSILEVHANSIFKATNLYSTGYAGDPASYKIFKRFYLLAEDYGKGVQPTFSAYSAPNEQSNYMHIGPYASSSASLLRRGNLKSEIQYVKTPRYWSDPGNAATYAMVDYAGAYQAAAKISFAHRHFAHFKKPGASEYVIAADAVRTTAGQPKVTFLHYVNNSEPYYYENGQMPMGRVNAAYSAQLIPLTGGTPPFTWTAGLVTFLDSNSHACPGTFSVTSTGLLTGVPNSQSTCVAAIPAVDSLGVSYVTKYALQVGGVNDYMPVEGATTVSGSTITSSSTGSRVITQVLAPLGSNSLRVYTDNADGSYTGTTDPAKGPLGGTGQTFRVSICASADGSTCDAGNLKTNILAVHRIVDGVTETSNPAALLATIDPNFMGIETDSAVAVFPVEGATLSSSTFTTTHAGTAQYLVSGLTAGSWSIYRNSTLVSASVTVDSNGVIYFEGTSGAYMLSRTGAGPLNIATTTLPDAAIGASYSVPLVATGGTPPYSWSVSSGTLPAWLSLSSGGTLSGTPPSGGSSAFQVKVTDGDSTEDTQDLTITVGVTPLSIVTTTPLPAASVGAAYSQTLTASGGNGSRTWDAPSQTCAWATLSSTGALTGTPSGAETCTVTARVTDLSGSASRTFSITVSSGATPLSVSTASLPGATVAVAYSATLAAAGGSGSKTWDLPSNSCDWLSVSSAGVLSGSPADPGTCTITAQVADSSGSATKEFTFTVAPGEITPPQTVSVSVTPARTSALITYGADTLPGNRACTITVSQGGTTVFSVTDTGGRPYRRTAATGLSAGAATVAASCLPYGSGVASTTILAASGQSANVPIQGYARAARGVAKMKVEWGYTAAMSEAPVVVSCTSNCSPSLPSVATGAVIWTRISYLTAGDAVVAVGPATAVVP